MCRVSVDTGRVSDPGNAPLFTLVINFVLYRLSGMFGYIGNHGSQGVDFA